jgi:hypothetical protein
MVKIEYIFYLKTFVVKDVISYNNSGRLHSI